MKYFPKCLHRHPGTLGDITDERGAYVGSVSSNGGDELDDEKIAAHIAACWNACSGIPTEALTPGLVGEMVEALKLARGNDLYPDCARAIDAILDRIGKAGA